MMAHDHHEWHRRLRRLSIQVDLPIRILPVGSVASTVRTHSAYVPRNLRHRSRAAKRSLGAGYSGALSPDNIFASSPGSGFVPESTYVFETFENKTKSDQFFDRQKCPLFFSRVQVCLTSPAFVPSPGFEPR